MISRCSRKLKCRERTDETLSPVQSDCPIRRQFYHSARGIAARDGTRIAVASQSAGFLFWFLNNYYALIILFLMRRTFCAICRRAANFQHLQHRRYMHALFIYRHG